MRILLSLIAGALLLLGVNASPASALTQDEATQIAADKGCPIRVFVIDTKDADDWNGYFAYGGWPGRQPYIALINLNQFPANQMKYILYHEIGHCLQGGGEWKADQYAIEELAKEGLDGADILASVWADEYGRSGWNGRAGSPHGLHTERIIRGYLNRKVYNYEAA